MTRTATDPPGSIFYWRHVDQGNTDIVKLYKLISFFETINYATDIYFVMRIK